MVYFTKGLPWTIVWLVIIVFINKSVEIGIDIWKPSMA